MTSPTHLAPQLLLDQQLCFALYAASRSLTSEYRNLLAPLDLTYPQYLAMLALWERDRRTVSELGQSLLLDSGTLTPLLKRLERAGLVQRQRRSGDERQVEVRLTETGRELRKQAESIPSCLVDRLGLSPHELRSLRTQLQVLVTRLKPDAGSPSSLSTR